MEQDSEEKAGPKESIPQIIYNVGSGGKVYVANDNAHINVETNQSSVEKAKQKIKSRTQEYADKWNSNMFLNDFDKYDENAGANVKLSEVYLDKHLPHYIWRHNKRVDTNLKEVLFEYTNEKFTNKMLLILGQPGIGKSTLITWITANFTDKIDNILVYRFTDLKDIDWQAYDVSNRILEELNLSHENLNGKVLIFDGFDEINVRGSRRDVLDKMYWNLIKEKYIRNFSIIITCRENYIQSFEGIECKYITLQSWDEEQIKSFCTVFQEKTNTEISEDTIKNVLVNKEILGVPLILYMVLALNISIEKEGSIVDVYDKIFLLEGGIYDRCIDNKSFESPHRIKEIKKQIHQISRDIAIWMFENNSEKASILQEEYQKICDIVMKGIEQKDKNIKQDILIGNYFRRIKHCEGIETEEIYFVHRSIYEYFVAETIYNSIEESIIELSEESQKELAGNIAWYLKKGKIDITIGEHIKHKILKLYNSKKLNDEKRKYFYQWWEETVEKMMSVGMFYYTYKHIQNYENIIFKEICCFLNLIKILIQLIDVNIRKYIMKNSKQLEKYVIYCCIEHKKFERSRMELNLSKVFLSKLNFSRMDMHELILREACLIETNLKEADLRKADLSNTYLNGADLRGADLNGAYLRDAYLEGADLDGANLRGADLQGADLRGADLSNADLDGADLRGADLQGSIWFAWDISKALFQLKEADFGYIINLDEIKEETYKNELFPD